LAAFTVAVAWTAGCSDREAADALNQEQLPAPPAPVADTLAEKGNFSPQLGMPDDPKVVPGTVGEGDVGEKITVDIKDHKLTISKAKFARGPVSFSFTNADDEKHILEIVFDYGGRWRSVPVGKGGFVIMKQSLDAGPYEIYCYVPGHRARGEKATFTVE
jgi:hypothetical protein